MMIMMMMEKFHWKFQPVGAQLPSLACDDQDDNHDDEDDGQDDEDDDGDGGGNFNLLELHCPADQTF